MIKQMSRLQIIGPKALLDQCVRALHSEAVVHVETVSGGEGAFFERLPLEMERLREKERLEKAAERLKNLLALLVPPDNYKAERPNAGEIDSVLEGLAPVEASVKEVRARKDEMAEELSVVNRYERLLQGFAPVVSRLGGLKAFDIIGLTLEKVRSDVAVLLEQEVSRVTSGRYQAFVKDLDSETVGVVLAYPREFEPSVRALLSGQSINEVRLPDEYAEMSLLAALKVMGKRKAELPWRIDEADSELRALSQRWYGVAIGLASAIGDELDEIGVLAYAGQTRFTFIIEGWVPTDMLPGLAEGLAREFGERVIVRGFAVRKGEEDSVPVCISNPALLRPFEVFLGVLTPPRYGSVDPTPYVALFFPTFFGLIVGDIGYGAIILIVSLLIRGRLANDRRLTDINYVVSISAVAAIVFGVLFGEFFGDLGERLGIIHPIVIDRIGALKTLLGLAIATGVGHVILGIVIGAVNMVIRRKARAAWGRLSYLAAVVSLLVIAGSFAGHLTRDLLGPGAVVFVISFVILTVTEGIIGPLELIKALGNMLSYVRLMAVGTASVVMAIVANKMGALSDNIFLGIMIAVIIHTLNLMLSVVSPSIQSMRLQYVEFFSKFYEGGGRAYLPFKKR